MMEEATSAAASVFKVPFTRRDWKIVSKAFHSDSIRDWTTAAEILTTWKLRAASGIPIAVEISDIIIRALIFDKLTSSEDSYRWWKTENIRLFHGVAIVRFVNFVNELGQCRTVLLSMTEAVRKHEVPDWIVQLRHAVSHEDLPPISDLRRAVDFCKTWLKEKYWSRPITEAVDLLEKNRRRFHANPTTSSVDRIHSVLTHYENLHSELLGKEVPEESVKTNKKHLCKKTLKLASNLMRRHARVFVNVLISEGHLILTKKQMKKCRWIDLKENTSLPPTLLQMFWKPLLSLVQKNGLQSHLLLAIVTHISTWRLEKTVRLQLTCWCNLMIDAFATNEDSETINFCWKDILRMMMYEPRRYDYLRIRRVVGVIKPSLEESDADALFDAADIYKGNRNTSLPFNSDWKLCNLDQMLPNLHADRQNVTRCEETMPLKMDSVWMKDSFANWKILPFGLAPNQDSDFLDFKLTFVENEDERRGKNSTSSTSLVDFSRDLSCLSSKQVWDSMSVKK